VASIDTYLRYADALGLTPPVRQSALGTSAGGLETGSARARQQTERG